MKTYYTMSCKKCGHVNSKAGMADLNKDVSNIKCSNCHETDALRYGVLIEIEKENRDENIND